MNNSHIVYVQRDGTSPGAEISALVSVYKLVIDRANGNATGVASINSYDATVKKNEEVNHVNGRTG